MKTRMLLSFLFAALLLPTMGCERIRHITRLDRHDATPVDVPLQRTIEDEVTPPKTTIALGFAHVNTVDATHAYLKTGPMSDPGQWSDLVIRDSADAAVTTVYLVIDYAAQSGTLYNLPATTFSVLVRSIPKGAYDPGRPPAF